MKKNLKNLYYIYYKMVSKVVNLEYIRNDTYGDFNWMINQPEYSNCLFIFVSLEENCGIINQKIDRLIGISIGSIKRGGYEMLTNVVQEIIDNNILDVKKLIKFFDYKTVYYQLNSSIKTNKDIINYIDEKINSLKN